MPEQSPQDNETPKMDPLFKKILWVLLALALVLIGGAEALIGLNQSIKPVENTAPNQQLQP